MSVQLKSVRLDSLQLNQKFVTSKNNMPSINVCTFKGGFFGMCHSETSKGTPRLIPSYALVFPLTKKAI